MKEKTAEKKAKRPRSEPASTKKKTKGKPGGRKAKRHRTKRSRNEPLMKRRKTVNDNIHDHDLDFKDKPVESKPKRPRCEPVSMRRKCKEKPGGRQGKTSRTEPASKKISTRSSSVFEKTCETNLRKLGNCKNLEQMQNAATELLASLPALPKVNNIDNSEVQEIDDNSKDLIPDDVDGTPVKITGDGDCFPHSLSVIAYGNEDHNMEMRLRMVICMCLQADQLQDKKYLAKGSNYTKRETDNVLKRYVFFEEN